MTAELVTEASGASDVEPSHERIHSCPHVYVGPFPVANMPYPRLVEAIAAGAVAQHRLRPYLVYAVHVGGLLARRQHDYIEALGGADLVYADGVSVLWLARVSGGRDVERCGTTDLGWDVIARLRDLLGRAPRVALVGGPNGLADKAGQVLENRSGAHVVLTVSGYRADWAEVLVRLGDVQADLVLVGMGAPREMLWVERHRCELPPSLVMTCGGWFGFIAGEERRAPRWARRIGVEWVFRLAQDPRRLASRYVRGALVTLGFLLYLGSGRLLGLRPIMDSNRRLRQNTCIWTESVDGS